MVAGREVIVGIVNMDGHRRNLEIQPTQESQGPTLLPKEAILLLVGTYLFSLRILCYKASGGGQRFG
jgi:hypothetical protein